MSQSPVLYHEREKGGIEGTDAGRLEEVMVGK
jgi:hypothetical protein